MFKKIFQFFLISKRKSRLAVLLIVAGLFLTTALVAIGCQTGKLIKDYKWPKLEGTGYKYGGAACGVSKLGKFNYMIHKEGATTGDKAFCCTQNGCSELEIKDWQEYFGGFRCPATSALEKTACKCKKNAGLMDYYDMGYSGANDFGCH